MAQHEFRTIQGYPCPKNIAPYWAICINDAHAVIQSLYRGDDARAILNAHQHHSQFQLYHATPEQRLEWHIMGQPNRPGTSSHEGKSDGVAYPIPIGHDLPWWGVGCDVRDGDSQRVINEGKKHGWEIFRPYPNVTSEIHHLNFRVQPKPHSARDAARIIRLRLTLPRH